VGQIQINIPGENRRSHSSSRVNFERSLKTGRSAQRPFAEARGEVCVSLVSELRRASFLSVAGRRKIHHAAKEKR
jgi:hypothetical protein